MTWQCHTRHVISMSHQVGGSLGSGMGIRVRGRLGWGCRVLWWWHVHDSKRLHRARPENTQHGISTPPLRGPIFWADWTQENVGNIHKVESFTGLGWSSALHEFCSINTQECQGGGYLSVSNCCSRRVFNSPVASSDSRKFLSDVRFSPNKLVNTSILNYRSADKKNTWTLSLVLNFAKPNLSNTIETFEIVNVVNLTLNNAKNRPNCEKNNSSKLCEWF